MYAIGGERCPVRLLRLYLSKRPESIQESGRFYLTPKISFNPNDDVWFMQIPIGKNTISGIMKALTSGTELENWKKKFTNHSIRKTTVKKLKAANIPESSIIKVTGHTTTKGLSSYDPGDENEFRSMSNALNAPSTGQDIRNNNPVYQSAFQSSFVQNVQTPQNVFHGC